MNSCYWQRKKDLEFIFCDFVQLKKNILSQSLPTDPLEILPTGPNQQTSDSVNCFVPVRSL